MVKRMEEQFLQYVKKMMGYHEAINLMYWDLRTGAPKKGVEQRSEVIGMLSEEAFKMSTSEEMAAFIAKLSPKEVYEQLDEVTKHTLDECKKEYERNKKIPVDEYKEYVVLCSKAESVWEEAKAAADFARFRPYLEQIIEFQRRFISYWGYEGHPYNTLLDQYEPGMTVELLDGLFGQLRERIVPLVHAISAVSDKPDTSFLFAPFPKEKQRAFLLELLRELGYDFGKGRLDETVHPFAIGLNPNDVRITTRYDERDFRTAVFGTIHECGHALYEQHISEALVGTPLASGASMGIHESQSLFLENMIGRHPSFWKRHYPRLQQYAPEQFADVSLDAFYRAINEAKPSLIRIEADELTYPLHIMVRYEIEKQLFAGELEAADLPDVWNEKYEQYLGIRPHNDAVGVLQDVHWSGGSFGYFPSYALGYMYAAQFKQALEKELDLAQLLEEGNITPIREWLTANIHRFGKTKKPLDLVRDATGEPLNADYLIQYLEAKYKPLYRL
ncbi:MULTISPECIES: carboxypeptidase M32 [Geobacillus]|uniref:Metal-dependent carboxypeptidase n=1 Tax=Geobacillus thermodenitrificans TaxID=33940 RepID=A0ABY9QFQ8_GEOTD|nr:MULTISPECIES: carboxypeptidase M32 [Geobacillus]ATO36151.1 carboxypeptidase M32 [Geobacillus thermodenitrificans]KQB93596.1 Carboxypeptidase 1 [Geobacillus sp. PA-3]MED0661570.1 carboxypeptidase M32 [Geobacillus thermodenitrificans]OQP09200.1 carboxypeptidase M32 [Geobacillus sp. 47C-IIb]PTR48128.1 carboxypeptidase M32 [Geobacillus thermodenitrificans]